MVKHLKQYPSVLYQLILISVVHQACFFLQYTFALSIIDTESDPSLYSSWIFTSNSFVVGGTYVVAGFLVDFFKHTKTTLLSALSLTFLSAVLAFLPFIEAKMLSVILAYIAVFMNQISCMLNIGILFPKANDWKDNAFLMFIIAPYILLFILNLFASSIIQMMHFEMVGGASMFFWMIGLGVLYLMIFKFENIGYTIEEGEESKEELTSGVNENILLFGMIIVATIIVFASQNIFKTTESTYGLGGLDGLFGVFNLGYVYFFQALFFGVGIYLLLLNTTFASRQISKITLFVGLLLLFGVADVIIGLVNIYTLDYSLTIAFPLFPNFFILPFLYATITHIRFDEKAGRWLGALMGIPTLLVAIIEQTLYGSDNYVFGIVSFLLLIPLFIWLKENQEFLTTLLQLDISNREEDNEEEQADPFDHLVGE